MNSQRQLFPLIFNLNILLFKTQPAVGTFIDFVQPISNGAELRTYSIYSSSLKSQYIEVPYTTGIHSTEESTK